MFEDFFDRLDQVHKQRRDEFEKLRLDQSSELPEVGDVIVVAGGPLNMGFEWIRHEAVVLAVAQQSIKIRFTDRKDIITGEPVVMWVHPAVVTDIIRQQRPEPDHARLA